MLRIKPLGFGAVIHYCYLDNNGAADMDGTMPRLFNNCLSVGLSMTIDANTESSHSQGTVIEIVDRYNSPSNCIGCSVVDELVGKGISVAGQNQVTATLKELADKRPFSIDYMWVDTPWEYKFSGNYNTFLVSSYSMCYSSGSLQERVGKGLDKVRTGTGGCMMIAGSARIVPTMRTFPQSETDPVEGMDGSYCFDADQIISAAQAFEKTGNEDFTVFCRGNDFTTTLTKEVKCQTLVKEPVNHVNKDETYRTEPILFGGIGRYPGRVQYPLGCLNAIQTYEDPLNTIGNRIGGDATPVKLMTGSSGVPLRMTLSEVSASGVDSSETFNGLATAGSLLKYFTRFTVFRDYGNPLLEPTSFETYSTTDGGCTEALRYAIGMTVGSSFRFSGLMTDNYDGIDDCAVFTLLINSSDTLGSYRWIICGLFINSD